MNVQGKHGAPIQAPTTGRSGIRLFQGPFRVSNLPRTFDLKVPTQGCLTLPVLSTNTIYCLLYCFLRAPPSGPACYISHTRSIPTPAHVLMLVMQNFVRWPLMPTDPLSPRTLNQSSNQPPSPLARLTSLMPPTPLADTLPDSAVLQHAWRELRAILFTNSSNSLGRKEGRIPTATYGPLRSGYPRLGPGINSLLTVCSGCFPLVPVLCLASSIAGTEFATRYIFKLAPSLRVSESLTCQRQRSFSERLSREPLLSIDWSIKPSYRGLSDHVSERNLEAQVSPPREVSPLPLQDPTSHSRSLQMHGTPMPSPVSRNAHPALDIPCVELEAWFTEWHKHIDNALLFLYNSSASRGLPHQVTRKLGLLPSAWANSGSTRSASYHGNRILRNQRG
ncbi:hypothetical protein AB1N83_012104 [Pleurotus pulmonarius]